LIQAKDDKETIISKKEVEMAKTIHILFKIEYTVVKGEENEDFGTDTRGY